MGTDTLLLIGIVTSVLFIAVLFFEGAIRPGYRPAYHTGSALSLGQRGWIQITNFCQMGVGILFFAVGVQRRLDSLAAGALLAIFGIGLIAAGVFVMDPMRGYPPGTPDGTPSEVSRSQQIHDVMGGPLAFLSVFGACLVVAGHSDGAWRTYSILTAIVGLGLTVATALAWQRDAELTGLIQRGLIVVYWVWIVLVGVHLLSVTPA